MPDAVYEAPRPYGSPRWSFDEAGSGYLLPRFVGSKIPPKRKIYFAFIRELTLTVFREGR